MSMTRDVRNTTTSAAARTRVAARAPQVPSHAAIAAAARRAVQDAFTRAPRSSPLPPPRAEPPMPQAPTTQAPTTQAPTTATTPAPSSSGVGDPAGPIQTVSGDWSQVNRWDSIIDGAAQEFGVPADLLKAMMVIESRGNPDALRPDDGWGGGASVGLMQIKPAYWGGLVPGADPYTPEGNVRIAAQLLKNGYDQTGSWDGAITQVYFPADDPNGTTQADYLALVDGLRGEINGA